MLKALKRVLWLCLTGGTVLAVDQTAKRLVVTYLELGQSWEPIPQISHFVRVTRSYNTGAAFGMFPLASDVFLVVALGTIAVFLLIIYPRLPDQAWLSRLSVGLIVGGALSNALDRLEFDGKVVDYVHVQIAPTFSNISNFADHAITIGVFLLLVDAWIIERRLGAGEQDHVRAAIGQGMINEMSIQAMQLAGFTDHSDPRVSSVAMTSSTADRESASIGPDDCPDPGMS